MSQPIRNIVAGISDVSRPDPILRSCVALADRIGATLHLVHAFSDPFAGVAPMQASFTSIDDHARTLRTMLGNHVRTMSGHEHVRLDVVAGPPTQLILEAAERESADLVVVGSAAHTALARVLGSTAQHVLRSSTVPVLILRGDLPEKIERVLLTTDLSELSGRVHELGIGVIERLFEGSTLEIRSLHVLWQSAVLPFPVRHGPLDRQTEQALAAFERHQVPQGHRVMERLRHGEPVREIVAEGTEWRADIIVVGTHGRNAVERWFLGSVAEATIRTSPTHVLVIPNRPPADGSSRTADNFESGIARANQH